MAAKKRQIDMSSFSSTVARRDRVVTRDTALLCLAFLCARGGVSVDMRSVRARGTLDGDTLLIAQLIELAEDFGYNAHYVHADWD